MKDRIRERLNQAIAMSGLSQRDIAKELGLGDATISKYFSGERTPNADRIVDLCTIFNCSADWLLGMDNENNNDIQT